MGTLYLVSTPIGNLGDLSVRAGQVLGGVDLVLAEDTRRSRVLLDHLGVTPPMVSLHEHNEEGRKGEVLKRLRRGDELALVTDAGTPLVSDPGRRLVYAAIQDGHRVVPIPGPSAVLAALVASGLPADRFTFLGFPPRKGPERREFLARMGEAEGTVVLFESPERLHALLEALGNGSSWSRRVAVARELTKVHEEFFRGTLEEAVRYYEQSPPRGEVTLVVEGASPASSEEDPEDVDEEAIRALARSALDRGLRPSQVARDVARRLHAPRNAVYRIVQSLEP